ncbi:tetratricopeptide repeat protein [Niveispirillum fermenti]|uniref:tetratricopeptide repeat protein n=1 Tax=Niveispirillum fermenti TaxID=1233113 RepID=UPI003A870C14
MASSTQRESLLAELARLTQRAQEGLAAQDGAGALAAAEAALRLARSDPYALILRGQALLLLGRAAAAAADFTTVLRTQPAMTALHMLLGNACRAQGLHAEAAEAYGTAVRLDPAMAGAWHNLGLTRIAQDRYADGARFLRRACALAPDAAASWNSLGAALFEDGADVAALCAFGQAARVAPADVAEAVRADWNRSMLLLARGDVRRGWPLFERRPGGTRGPTPAPFGLPFITGRPEPGMRVLVTVEQGLGDIVTVLRFIPLLAAQGVRIVMHRPAPLRRLLDGFAGVETFLEDGDPVPAVDGVLPCLSLPGLFIDDAGHVPGPMPYLSPDPELVAQWRPALSGAVGLKVGFVWAGNPDYKRDRSRSPGLGPVLPLMRLPGITPVILQKGGGRNDLDSHDLPGNAIDLAPGLGDLADTLAVLSQLDLLVSACTMPVHLAGAAGVPVAILLSAVPDWRWGHLSGDSPWYPSARLYRQARAGDWSDPVGRLGRDLSQRVAGMGVTV